MNIFNYESKFNQMMLMVADMIILNLLYVLCCIPIFTIGAAQAGLFTGLRVLMDKEDDNPVSRAFFRGFASGFKSITIVNVVYLLILAGLSMVLYPSMVYMFAGGSKLSTVFCIIAMSIVYCLHSISGPFHATFGCTTKQLFRNSLFLFMAHPLRVILSAVLILFPVAILLIWPDIFLGSLIILCALYYSAAYLLIYGLLKKPFQALKDDFYAAQKAKAEAEQSEDTEE